MKVLDNNWHFGTIYKEKSGDSNGVVLQQSGKSFDKGVFLPIRHSLHKRSIKIKDEPDSNTKAEIHQDIRSL